MDIDVRGIITEVFRLERNSPPNGTADSGELSKLPREERIIHLLAASGGYSWQGDLVSELGISEATISRTLSAMERDERITRYRIGRRNVVCLPDQEPDGLRRRRGER